MPLGRFFSFKDEQGEVSLVRSYVAKPSAMELSQRGVNQVYPRFQSHRMLYCKARHPFILYRVVHVLGWQFWI